MRKLNMWLWGLLSAVSLGVSACAQVPQQETAAVVSTESHVADRVLAGTSAFDLAAVPAYSGQPYIVVHNNEPYFADTDLTEDSFETYSDLDSLGRCGTAYASVGTDLMPTQERGAIGQVKPSGWHTIKYDNVDGKYLYNRCHLIGYQLTAENANEKNLITGTRYLNVQGMLPFENMAADYIKETGNHVLYRVTPIFEGNNLLASGVLMEAESVEDKGAGVLFCVYVYNVQPGIEIDYTTGDSSDFQGESTKEQVMQTASSEQNSTETVETAKVTETYILNTNTKKFHRPSCSSVKQMKESNKKALSESRDAIIAAGYDPCKKCNP
ncbi:hypothetical protein DXA97_06135 [Clostridium sp. OF09-36]|uniref:DNA/RNA non-specific endonuclease n=1 Tax=Clostridium sp. OF09-36 TaxID=2292310 RepID=UPI000E522B8C|nr:DNA/RNA non-specific endonuclease [Clostridium sp. OF09-36]RHV88742.1 hypothetical protein DXA97_06135 [Clostridium sp. OF09-36]